MTADEAKSLAEEIAKTAEVFGETMLDARIVLYLEALDDLPADALLWALKESRKRLKWFPKPAELRELLVGSQDDQGARSWARFLRALEAVGTHETVTFDDMALHATIEALGGWHEAWRIERLDAREQGFKRAEFLRLYTAFQRAPGRATPVLLGQHALTNRLTQSSWKRGQLPASRLMAIGPSGEAQELRALPGVEERRALPAAEERIDLPEALKALRERVFSPPATDGDRSALLARNEVEGRP